MGQHMHDASLTSFDQLEEAAVTFARKLIQRGECSDCVCRALAFASMGLAFDTDNVPSGSRHARCVAGSERAGRASRNDSGAGAALTHDKTTPAARSMVATHGRNFAIRCCQVAGFKCSVCGELTPQNLHVHHRKKLRTAPALAYEPLNLQTLCNTCHNSEEPRNGMPQRGCDIDGNPLRAEMHPWNKAMGDGRNK